MESNPITSSSSSSSSSSSAIWWGWPTMRSSPLCSGLQLASHGTLPRNWASSVVSVGRSTLWGDRLKAPKIRAVRKDASGLPTWWGVLGLNPVVRNEWITRTVHQFVYFHVPKSGHTKADVGCHWTFWQAAFQLTFSVFPLCRPS